jgi:hypothetical protein
MLKKHDLGLALLHPHPCPLPRKRWRGNFLKNDLSQGLCPCERSFFKFTSPLSFREGGIKREWGNDLLLLRHLERRKTISYVRDMISIEWIAFHPPYMSARHPQPV